ncbi:putative MFS family arabinose efflux permease [Halohasta litchfieldiae]|uniref:Predicted arabinose efflux permease, MFS family n=1 Tax=Halohasta litchfieldiae TaxID=1073996 RepID=A0A1H6TX31_9EURY|nr:putative MFS family arabinose efflux permease [Halohasta litchfieldiae]SEI80775.1 Predicted arabinose efflux permease, MFS family [Halohasta litchfieldiae]
MSRIYSPKSVTCIVLICFQHGGFDPVCGTVVQYPTGSGAAAGWSSVGETVRRAVDRCRRLIAAQSPVILAVIASTFFIGFGGGVVFPILPNLGALLGISPFVVGVILSANRFSRLVANAPAGSLVDRIGTRTPFVVGMGIQSVGTVGYLVALVAPLPAAWFLVARIGWGIGSALVFATAYTIAADLSDSGSRGANMGLVRGGVLFGFPTGVVLGGVVSELAGTMAAFGLATAFAFGATLLSYFIIPETHVDSVEGSSVSPWDIHTALPTLTVGVTNFVVLFVYIGALFATLVLFLPAIDVFVFGLGAQGSSGIFMAITVLSAGLFMFTGGYVSDRRGSRVPILLGFLVTTAVGFLLLALAESTLSLAVACLAIGAGQGGTSGPLMALLADLTPTDQMGRAVGTNNVFGDVGGGLGPVVTLPLVDTVGFVPIYLVCAALPLVAAVVLVGGIYRETGQFVPAVGS